MRVKPRLSRFCALTYLPARVHSHRATASRPEATTSAAVDVDGDDDSDEERAARAQAHANDSEGEEEVRGMGERGCLASTPYSASPICLSLSCRGPHSVAVPFLSQAPAAPGAVTFKPLPPPRMRLEPVRVEFTKLETGHLPAR